MANRSLPVYTIPTLKDTPVKHKELVVDHFAHYLDEHPNLKFPHKHDFYHLVYFSKGSGTHSIDFIEFPVKPGQIYFMIPGQVHEWHFKTKPDGFIVNFSVEYMNLLLANTRYFDQFRFFSGNAQDQVVQLEPDSRKEVEQLLQIITREGAAEKAWKDDFIRTALIQLFILVSRCAGYEEKSDAINYNSVLLKNFQQLINIHFREKKLTRDYAALLYVTPNHLNALCKDITGRSAGELIRERIILEAKRMLVNASLNIAEIADELSFEDHSYFSKFFKKYAGITPEQFRKQITQK